MNMKRLVLGTAAGALAVTGVSSAQAADLPVVVDPVDYVRICDAYGSGYYFIPGTETCLRIAGRVRADYNIYFLNDETIGRPSTVAAGATPIVSLPQFAGLGTSGFVGGRYALNGANGFQNANDRGYRFRARGYIYMESRSATEFGLLRTYTEVQFTRDNAGGTGVNLDSAVIQFGGLIFGRTDSLYDFDDVGGNWQSFGRFASDRKTELIGYQAAFGNGFSAAISLEDQASRNSGVYQWTQFAPGVYTTANRQTTETIPDIVGNIRVDQGWGSAQIMAAGHLVQASGITFNTANVTRFGYDDKYGFAVGGGVSVNLPFGNSTSVGIQANYAHGAIDYALSGPGSYIGYADAVITPNGDIELVDIFSVEAVISGSFSPNVVASLGGGYAYIDHAAVQMDPGQNAGLESLDSNIFGVTGYVGYRPVSGLEFGIGADFIYQDTDDFGEGSALSTFFRAQRTF